MPVPANAASQPAASMILAWKALGAPSTARTRSSRASSALSFVEGRGAARSDTIYGRSGIDRCALEPTVEARGVVPEELALHGLWQIPRHHRIDRLWKPALSVRVVRGVHQDILAEELDDRLRQLDAFRHLDGLEETTGGDVVGRLALERGQSSRDGLGVLVKSLGPERKPAVAGLEHSQSQIWIPIEHTRADERGHVAHTAPWMRGRALQPEVVPRIQTSRRVRRHDGERVEHDRQVVMLRGRPVRLEIGM